MGVDQPGRHEAAVGVEHPVPRRAAGRRRRRPPAMSPPVTATQPPGISRRSSSTVATSRAPVHEQIDSDPHPGPLRHGQPHDSSSRVRPRAGQVGPGAGHGLQRTTERRGPVSGLLTLAEVRAYAPVHPSTSSPSASADRPIGPRSRRTIDTACRDTGFLLVTGHGVPDAPCATGARRVRGVLRPPARGEAAGRGGRRVGEPAATASSGRRGLAYSRGDETPPDLFEAFNVGREDVDRARNTTATASFYAPNVWPDRPAGLRGAWLAYESVPRASPTRCCARWPSRSSCRRRGSPTSASGRSSPRGRSTTEHAANAPDPSPGRCAWRPHRLRHPDDPARRRRARPPGLGTTALARVATPRGTFVCNIGDMLERWTNTAGRRRCTACCRRTDQAGPVRGALDRRASWTARRT